MNDSSNNLNIEPVTFENYSFGKIEMDDFQISNLNLAIFKLSQSKEAIFNDSFGVEWEISFVGLIDYLFHHSENVGPFLIISKSYQKWAELIRNIEGIKPLIYCGNQQERKLIHDTKMVNQDGSLNFNILISTTEISEIDYKSSINEFYYQLAIFHNSKTVKYMPKSCKTIRYTQNFSKIFPLDLPEIKNFADENYYQDADIERQQEKIDNFDNLLTFISSKPPLKPPDYFYLNCPLCDTQKAVLKKLLFQSELNFSSLCQSILRVCSHPFLVFKAESLVGHMNYIEASTKLSVFAKLVTEKLTDAKKILVISQFNGVLDLIEDFAIENKILYSRLIDPKFDYDDQDTLLMLYNPLFCQIDITTEFIDYFVVFDGDHSIILNGLLRNPARKLKSIIFLQCQELFETRLTKVCTHGLNLTSTLNNSYQSSKLKNEIPGIVNYLDFQYSYLFNDYKEYDPNFEAYMSELLCRIAAAAALSPPSSISIDSIISSGSNEPIETNSIFDIQFCQSENFWEVLKETAEYKIKPEFPLVPPNVDEGKHKWTTRERDQLIHGLIGFGWDRWDEIISNGGLDQISKESIIQTSRSLLRFFLRSSSSPYPLIRQFIRESSNGEFINEEKADQLFMEKEPVFSEHKFKMKLKSNSDFYLKRIESLSYLRLTIEAYIGNIPCLPISRTIGDSPTLTWTELHDRILLLGSYKYGFGSYDHFPEDEDQSYREVSFCAEQFLLNKRLLKLTEHLKRNHDAGFMPTNDANSGSEDNFEESYNAHSSSTSRKIKVPSSDDENNDVDVEANLSCHWSKEEKNQILKFMSEKGVIDDLEEMRIQSKLTNKTVEQVKEFIDDYVNRINSEDNGGLKAKTSIKMKRRIMVLDELRTILNFELQNNPDLYKFNNNSFKKNKNVNKADNDDDDYKSTVKVNKNDNLKIFEKVPHWKKLPPNWTPGVERYFFTQIAIYGYKDVGTILSNLQNKRLIDIKTIPHFVEKFDSIYKRIHNTLYEQLLQVAPSLSMHKIHNNSEFFEYEKVFIQQQIEEYGKAIPTEATPPPTIQQTTININIKKDTNETVKEQPIAKVDTESNKSPNVEVQPQTENEQQPDEDSKQSDEDDEDECKTSSDYSDEYQKPKIPKKPSSKPVATKEQITRDHKEQLKQKIQPPPSKNVDSGNFKIEDFPFPIPITHTSAVLNIGTIVYDRPGFHSERYIYPAGYKSVKMYNTIGDINTRSNYISEIIDNGSDYPLFRVTMEGSNYAFEGNTPTAPWSCVLKEVFKNVKRTKAVSGPDSYLLAQPRTLYLIQLLPNAEKCFKYKFKSFSNSVPVEMIKQANEAHKKGLFREAKRAEDEVQHTDEDSKEEEDHQIEQQNTEEVQQITEEDQQGKSSNTEEDQQIKSSNTEEDQQTKSSNSEDYQQTKSSNSEDYQQTKSSNTEEDQKTKSPNSEDDQQTKSSNTEEDQQTEESAYVEDKQKDESSENEEVSDKNESEYKEQISKKDDDSVSSDNTDDETYTASEANSDYEPPRKEKKSKSRKKHSESSDEFTPIKNPKQKISPRRTKKVSDSDDESDSAYTERPKPKPRQKKVQPKESPKQRIRLKTRGSIVSKNEEEIVSDLVSSKQTNDIKNEDKKSENSPRGKMQKAKKEDEKERNEEESSDEDYSDDDDDTYRTTQVKKWPNRRNKPKKKEVNQRTKSTKAKRNEDDIKEPDLFEEKPKVSRRNTKREFDNKEEQRKEVKSSKNQKEEELNETEDENESDTDDFSYGMPKKRKNNSRKQNKGNLNKAKKMGNIQKSSDEEEHVKKKPKKKRRTKRSRKYFDDDSDSDYDSRENEFSKAQDEDEDEDDTSSSDEDENEDSDYSFKQNRILKRKK